MADSNLSVTISLNEIRPENALPAPFPLRTLVLQAPDWSATVGRSTSTGNGPRAGDNNAWYNSRVVSRDHATLRANPETRELLISDVGSMHGTHVLGRRLRNGRTERMYDGDKIVFGAEVARGEEIFSPVEVVFSFAWSDGSCPDTSGSRPLRPEDSKELDVYDSDISENSVIEPRIRIQNNFSVPESDISDDNASVLSDAITPSEQGSPTSSPVKLSGDDNKVSESKENDVASQFARGTSSPALGGEIVDPFLNEEDSYYDESSMFEEDLEFGPNITNKSEHVPQSSYDARHNFPTLATSARPRLSPPLPSPRSVRKPSPSDAAMVKPVLPPIQADSFCHIYHEPGLPVPFSRSNGAWAGHHSIIEADAYDQEYDDQIAYIRSHPYTGVSANYSRPSWAEAEVFVPGQPSNGLSNASQVVTTSYTDPVPNPQLGNSTGKKRKAGEISEDSVKPGDTITSSTSVQVSLNVPNATEATGVDPALVIDSVESIKSPEPARKKRKKNKHDIGKHKANQGPSFKKYAATALAGAVVGAAGTIWGLVALPKDFFA